MADRGQHLHYVSQALCSELHALKSSLESPSSCRPFPHLLLSVRPSTQAAHVQTPGCLDSAEPLAGMQATHSPFSTLVRSLPCLGFSKTG